MAARSQASARLCAKAAGFAAFQVFEDDPCSMTAARSRLWTCCVTYFADRKVVDRALAVRCTDSGKVWDSVVVVDHRTSHMADSSHFAGRTVDTCPVAVSLRLLELAHLNHQLKK